MSDALRRRGFVTALSDRRARRGGQGLQLCGAQPVRCEDSKVNGTTSTAALCPPEVLGRIGSAVSMSAVVDTSSTTSRRSSRISWRVEAFRNELQRSHPTMRGNFSVLGTLIAGELRWNARRIARARIALRMVFCCRLCGRVAWASRAKAGRRRGASQDEGGLRRGNRSAAAQIPIATRGEKTTHCLPRCPGRLAASYVMSGTDVGHFLFHPVSLSAPFGTLWIERRKRRRIELRTR